ncbi:hypothetical protein DENSPDRAFT_421883 [Dentipellis sp. KUC8613]|nr:hypothetical protein DENSPDRAFT_421883 [Dentipellis sp. KUC8613]
MCSVSFRFIKHTLDSDATPSASTPGFQSSSSGRYDNYPAAHSSIKDVSEARLALDQGRISQMLYCDVLCSSVIARRQAFVERTRGDCGKQNTGITFCIPSVCRLGSEYVVVVSFLVPLEIADSEDSQSRSDVHIIVGWQP